ncbi:MAG: type II toxin-antitoxin system RelE/ParE family toxin [Chthonomonadetes bacterium]|nr:type II toxin-antitoxin system RelE/ParE family toxin [Chthonomonadetes bacterium]
MARLDKSVAQRVLKKRWLAENFEHVPQEGLTGDLRDVYKLRVGDYRVLYTVNREKQEIIVHIVRHRSEVYKSL